MQFHPDLKFHNEICKESDDDRRCVCSRIADVIPLPNGFQPEGIAGGNGTTFYVGSVPTGAICPGDLWPGKGAALVPAQTGRSATGLKYDSRTGLLFAEGATTGYAYIYDGQPELYRVPLANNDQPLLTNETIPFSGDYQFDSTPGAFNANGIVATPNGKTLIIVNSVDGALYNVDPQTGVATRIDLGGDQWKMGMASCCKGRPYMWYRISSARFRKCN